MLEKKIMITDSSRKICLANFRNDLFSKSGAMLRCFSKQRESLGRPFNQRRLGKRLIYGGSCAREFEDII